MFVTLLGESMHDKNVRGIRPLSPDLQDLQTGAQLKPEAQLPIEAPSFPDSGCTHVSTEFFIDSHQNQTKSVNQEQSPKNTEALNLHVLDTYEFPNGLRVQLSLHTSVTNPTNLGILGTDVQQELLSKRISYTVPSRFPTSIVEKILEKRAEELAYDLSEQDHQVVYLDCVPEGCPTTVSNNPQAGEVEEFTIAGRVAGYRRRLTQKSDTQEQSLNMAKSHAFVAFDHHVDFKSKTRLQETSVSLYLAAWLRKMVVKAPVCITHTDPDTVLSVALVAETVPPKYAKLVLHASRVADHGTGTNALTEVLTIAQSFNNLQISLQVLQTYFAFLDQEEKNFRPGEKTIKAHPLLEQRRLIGFIQFLMRLQKGQDGSKNILPSNLKTVIAEFIAECKYTFLRNARIDTLFDSLDLPNEQDFDADPNTLAHSPLELGTDGTFALKYFGQGVFLIDNESDPRYEYIDSDQLPSVLPAEIAKKARVLVFSRKIPQHEPWALPVSKRGQDYSSDPKQKNGRDAYEVKVRVIDSAISLYELPDLDLSETEKRASGQPLEWSFGGRREAGSTYRDGGSTKTGTDFASAIATSLASYPPRVS